MNQQPYPLLTALARRGPASDTGPDLSWLPIELRGVLLEVRGATPLRYGGDGCTTLSKKYCYLLKAPEVETPLGALRVCSGERPEQLIPGEFEFIWPQRLLEGASGRPCIQLQIQRNERGVLNDAQIQHFPRIFHERR